MRHKVWHDNLRNKMEAVLDDTTVSVNNITDGTKVPPLEFSTPEEAADFFEQVPGVEVHTK